MKTPKQILQHYWKFSSFRKPQEEIIQYILEGKDVIGLLPTGGGKSICFQIPTLLKEGICIVISPLIALMQDQVTNLNNIGIKAIALPSGKSQNELITLFDNIKFGKIKFLYLSPERLQTVFIQQKIKELNVNLIAVDEAHCISEWGHDFRPSYRNISVLKELQPNVPVIALTATANKKILIDIEKNLQLNTPKIVTKSFFKENLGYQIVHVEDKLQKLIQIFTKLKSPAIVYVNSRKSTQEIATYLNENNYGASFYHAGLSSVEKQIAFTNWMTEKTPIIVATNAFGMGIDKPNVGVVIHYNLPSSIENYVQESGRAGRNLKKSFAVLFKNEHDIFLFKNQLEKFIPSIADIKAVHHKLYQHFQIYFGEITLEHYDFSMLAFCKKYNFSSAKVTVILKILANNGIIEIGNNFNKKSTLQFIVSSKAILNYVANTNSLQLFTTTLLRTYGGLFENKVTINEFTLAKKTGITSTKVIQYLKRLHDNKLVDYNPSKSNALLHFLLPREDDKTINKFSKEIKQFLVQKKQKATDFINYINNNTICRSIQLLNYFDKKNSKKCGICDVCMSENKKIVKNLSAEISQLLIIHKKLTSFEISTFLNANEKDILIHLRQLLADEIIAISHQNKYYLAHQL